MSKSAFTHASHRPRPQSERPQLAGRLSAIVPRLRGTLTATLLVLAASSLPAAPAQAAAEVVYSLGLHSNESISGGVGIARTADGTVYGTSGASSNGLLFKLASDGSYTNLHYFGDGRPVGNPLLASDGNLYGVSQGPGCGTVWRYTAAGVYSVLYSFSGGTSSCSPQSGVIEGGDGFLYGTTSGGGAGNNGTVYRLSKAGAYSLLYAFDDTIQGQYPYAPLVQGNDGDLYGTTYLGGGSNRYGVVFKVSTSGSFTRVFAFPDSNAFGNEPIGGLAQAGDGSFVGTVAAGLTNNNGGLYRLTFNGGNAVVAIVREFGLSEIGGIGGNPRPAPVVRGADGAIYGLLGFQAGANGYGLLYRYSSADGFAKLRDLTLADGYPGSFNNFPALGGDGRLYFAADVGGDRNLGALVRFTSGGAFTRLLSLNDPATFEGRYPQSPLLQVPDGSFYGSASSTPGNAHGRLFRLAADGSFKVVLAFDGSTLGDAGIGSLLRAADGSLIGEAHSGGPGNAGLVFRFTPNADPSQPGSASVLRSFDAGANGADGYYPSGGLALGADGAYYGMNSNGSVGSDSGTLFRITGGGSFTRLCIFPGDGSMGRDPEGGLTAASDGFLYGVTVNGGADTVGTLFRTGTAANSLAKLYEFQNLAGAPRSPTTRPIEGRDGALYGVTMAAGNVGYGAVYRITKAGAFSRLFSFDDYNMGAYPGAPLLAAGDGNFYGTTTQGGNSGRGTVFRLTPQGDYRKLYDFSRAPDGDTPQAALIQAANGDLYATTYQGGALDDGALLRLDGPADIPANLSASAGSQQVNLSWSASRLALTYSVYQGLASGAENATPIASGLTTPTLSVGALTDGTPYFFTVTAVNALGETQMSAEVTATPVTDTTPDGFSFIDLSSAPVSTSTLSNTVTVNGINLPVPLVLSGAASAQYSINGAKFKYYNTNNGQPMVSNHDSLRLRLTSAATGNTPTTATVTLGGVSSTWSVTTTAMASTPRAFDFKDKSNQPVNRTIGSGGVRIAGINVPVAISVGGDASASYRVNAAPYTSAPGMVSNGDLVVLRLKSAGTANTTRAMTVNIGGVSDSWSVTTSP